MAVPERQALSRGEIGDFMSALGIEHGRVVVVHSSFRRFSHAGYKTGPFVQALIDAVGPGTLVMPTMSWRAVNLDNPVFDAASTPSITGVLTETFRRSGASHRSLHPTHSVAAVGDAAAYLTGDHHRDKTPCGIRSPWGRLAEADALVVMLDVGMDSCTLVHHLEEAHEPSRYLREDEESYRCIALDGSEHSVITRRHLKLERSFWKFEDLLRAHDLVRDAALQGAAAFAFPAKSLVDLGKERMNTDPYGSLAAPGERAKLM